MISPEPAVLSRIWERYALGAMAHVESLSGGMINQTHLVTAEDGERYVVQKLQKIFGAALMEDIAAISEHLERDGWTCPRPLLATDGKNFVLLDDGIWRAYRYIPGSDFASLPLDTGAYAEIGGLLASLHKSLKTLDYRPVHALEGFHDKDFYVRKAFRIGKERFPAAVQEVFDELLARLEEYAQQIAGPEQVIHGDPRVENTLIAADGKPVTFIDFDTFMWGSIYIDIGDCLRSMMYSKDAPAFRFRVGEFVAGYSAGNPEAQVTMLQALAALKYITLELTLRFAIDAVEQDYFAWDHERYPSSAAHNTERAIEHWHLYQKISKRI